MVFNRVDEEVNTERQGRKRKNNTKDIEKALRNHIVFPLTKTTDNTCKYMCIHKHMKFK